MALVATCLIAACESPASPGIEVPKDSIGNPTPVDTAVGITSVGSIQPCKVVQLQGKNLNRLTNLRADGSDVAFSVLSAEQTEFTMHAGVACDTDGRAIEIVANSTSKVQGPLRLENALHLEVGESRILSAQDLACIQIASGAETYLLSIASHTGAKVLDNVLRLHTPGANGQGQAVASSTSAAGQNLHSPHAQAHTVQSVPVNASVAPTPFDNYAGALAGDTVRMVDWDDYDAIRGAKSVEDLPTYKAFVVAATASQIFVINVAYAANFATPSARAKFQQAGEIADLYMLPALRAVIDPNLQLPREGAGGKVMNILDTTTGWFSGVRAEEIMKRLGASHMYATRLSAYLLDNSAEAIAGVVIHEAAHLADGYRSNRGEGGRSAGWYMEALAVSVEDMAARMAMGEYSPRSFGASAGVPNSKIRMGPSGSAPTASPWGAAGSSIGAGGPGSYDRGARILRYAQQKAGELTFTRTGPTLHQRLLAGSEQYIPTKQFDDWVRAWNVDAIAAAIGMSAEQLLDESMMADLTDDLVPATAVARFDIPQNEAWDQSYPSGRLPFNRIERGAAFDRAVAVPAGGYAYWYVAPGEGGGFSLQGSDIELLPHHLVRLTRVR